MIKDKISVIGLGYVGLPLATLFASKYSVIGFDINQKRIDELRKGLDSTLEVEFKKLETVLLEHAPNEAEIGLFCSSDINDLSDSNFYIITVPTPVDKHNRPDLTPLIKASETVGKVLSKGDIVVYESTVYPGATEEVCIPILEKASGLKFNTDFFAGYSPERINPGDKEHTVEKILKITSGSTQEAAQKIDSIYRSVIVAGTHLAPTIRVAEAAKVIENAQRDINIAFVNELAKIFNKMNINTQDVLAAAATKWNFLPFKPGLVGGHCIGVDPYYLAQKAQEYGYHPEIILSGRRLNDGMGEYIAKSLIKGLIKRSHCIKGARVLVLGFTFKENCPDVRNTKVVDVIHCLREFELDVDVFDPWADPREVEHEYTIQVLSKLDNTNPYDAVLMAVAHKEFESMDIQSMLNQNGIIYDVKGVLKGNADLTL